jgi:uncharacterized protein
MPTRRSSRAKPSVTPEEGTARAAPSAARPASSQAPTPTPAHAATPSAHDATAAYLAIGRVLVDSGPLLALFNRNDHWHTRVREWLAQHPQAQLLTTWPVATEVCALLARRLHNDAALDFLRWAQRGGIGIQGPLPESLPDILALSERFASMPFDLADASIAEAAARLKVRQVLSIDADFDADLDADLDVYRDRSGRALQNLLR